jgi:Mrp family chromosome partitioning ATPase
MALERDLRVLLVDGDVANPSIPRVLGLDRARGLMDALLDPGIALGDLYLNTDIGNLEILQAGTWHEHATELLASEAMQDLVATMAGSSSKSIVIFDSPPLLMASEASALARHVGQIVVVAAEGETRKSDLMEALGRIDQDKLAGLVLNKGRGFKRGYGYGGYGSR